MFSSTLKSLTSTLAAMESDITKSLSPATAGAPSLPLEESEVETPGDSLSRGTSPAPAQQVAAKRSLTADFETVALDQPTPLEQEVQQLRRINSDLQLQLKQQRLPTPSTAKASDLDPVQQPRQLGNEEHEKLKLQYGKLKSESAKRIAELGDSNKQLEKKFDMLRVKAKERIADLQKQLDAVSGSANAASASSSIETSVASSPMRATPGFAMSTQDTELLEQKLAQLATQSSALEEQLKERDHQVAELAAQVQDRDQQAAKLTDQVHQCEQEVAKLAEQVKLRDEKIAQLDAVEHERDQLKAERDQLKAKLSSAPSTLTTLSEEGDTRLAELQEQIQSLQVQLDQAAAEHKAALTQSQEQVKAAQQAREEAMAQSQAQFSKLAQLEKTVQMAQQLEKENGELKSQVAESTSKIQTLQKGLEAAIAASGVPSLAEVDLKTELSDARKKIQSLEDATFSTDEQIKDLRIQVTQRQLEVARLSDILKQQSQQNDQSAVKNDEKLKKLKDLLSAANKMIAEKKEQVKTLSDQLDESRSNVGSVADERNKHMHALNEAKEQVEQLREELMQAMQQSSSQQYAIEKRAKAAETELQNVRAEFEQHKARAKKILSDRNIETLQAKAASQDQLISELQRANESHQESVAALQASLEQARANLDEANARRRDLENQMAPLKERAEQVIRWREESARMTERVETMEKSIRDERKEMLRKHGAEIKVLRDEASTSYTELESKLRKKDQELEASQLRAVSLTSQLSSLREELQQALQQQQQQQHSVSVSSSSVPGTASSSSRHLAPIETDSSKLSPSIPLPLHDLLNGGGAREVPSETIKALQTKIEHMAELLSDSENNIERLTAQERVLKEEIRRLDGLHGMQDMNVAYVKNVLFKFFETDDRPSLVPVVATMLHLSPDEVRRLRESIKIQQGLVNTLNSTLNTSVTNMIGGLWGTT